MYQNETIPEPHTFWDDHATRSAAAAAAAARCHILDLDELDLKAPIPDGLTDREEVS